jgi:hypothetical protein
MNQAHRWPRSDIERVANGAQERTAVVVMESVPATSEFLEPDPFDSVGQRSSVRWRNDCVAIPPENGDRRKVVDLVRVQEKRMSLTPPIHEGTHRPRKCSGAPSARVHHARVDDVTRSQLRPPSTQKEPGADRHERLPDALDEGGE